MEVSSVANDNQSASPKSWLEASGQELKLQASKAVIFVGGAFWLLSKFVPDWGAPPALAISLQALASLVAIGALLFPLLAIRCEKCGARVAAHFIRTSHFNHWLLDLESTAQCPKCGDSGVVSRTSGERSAKQVG